jgi:hypothetical protein
MPKSIRRLCLLLGMIVQLIWSEECIVGDDCTTDDPSRFGDSFAKQSKYPKTKTIELYDVWNCPDLPPDGYPIQWPAQTVLRNWRTNVTEIPERIHQGLCFFDVSTDMTKAWSYLDKDKPFIVRNTPDLVAAAKRWAQPGYLEKVLGDTKHPVHKSPSHEFKYWVRKEYTPEGWTEPTEVLRIPYHEYLKLKSSSPKANETHYYFYAEGFWSISPGEEHFRFELFNELERFKPGQQPELFMENFGPNGPPEISTFQKLHCKIGQAGNMAVMHFDSSRNTLVLLKGQRRYLLADPSQCGKLNLHQTEHPSNRHTTLDFGNLPEDLDLYLNEVVMNPGDTLILPSYWFHSIIGLSEETAQCNAWSIATMTHKRHIEKCGNFAIGPDPEGLKKVEEANIEDASSAVDEL